MATLVSDKAIRKITANDLLDEDCKVIIHTFYPRRYNYTDREPSVYVAWLYDDHTTVHIGTLDGTGKWKGSSREWAVRTHDQQGRHTKKGYVPPRPRATAFGKTAAIDALVREVVKRNRARAH